MAERKSYSITKLDSGIVTNMPSSGVVISQGRNVSFRPGCVYKIPGKTLLTTTSPIAAVRAMFVFRGYDNVWRNIVCCDTKIYSYTNNFASVLDITPGTGCTLNITAPLGIITVATVVSGGSNYAVGDTMTVYGGNNDAVMTVATATGTAVATVTITAGGTGYTTGTPYLTINTVAIPSSISTDTWVFGIIGGMPVLSNGVNPPWQWPNFANTLRGLTNAPVTCGAIHIHENRMIVGNISENGYSFPARIRWSQKLSPTTWTRDLSLSSGKKDLVNPSTSLEGQDRVQAITDLGGRLIVFSLRNIWFGTPVEHPAMYTFTSLDKDIGLVAPKAFVKTPDGIYFMAQEEIYFMGNDGGLTPLAFPIRNSVFPNLYKLTINTAFAYYKMSTREVVFCYPTGANTTPDTAAIYQTETKSWSFWDVDYLSHSQYFESSNLTWETLPYGSWNAITDTRWDLMGTTGLLPYECVGNSAGQIFKQDSGNNNNGAAIDAYIETGDISLDSQSINKIIYEVWLSLKPQISISAIMVQVGTRDNLHQDILWCNPVPYTIGVSRNACVRKQGKWIRLRFYSNVVDSPWVLESADIKYEFGGTR